MEMTCNPEIIQASAPSSFITIDKEEAFGPEFSMLSVITRLERLVGLQQNITLCANSPKEMVRALRFHPRYEHLSMKELLSIVRKRTKGGDSMVVKLSEKLVPVYTAVLVAECIGVQVVGTDESSARLKNY